MGFTNKKMVKNPIDKRVHRDDSCIKFSTYQGLSVSVIAHIIALLHVGLINVFYLTACVFIRSS